MEGLPLLPHSRHLQRPGPKTLQTSRHLPDQAGVSESPLLAWTLLEHLSRDTGASASAASIWEQPQACGSQKVPGLGPLSSLE